MSTTSTDGKTYELLTDAQGANLTSIQACQVIDLHLSEIAERIRPDAVTTESWMAMFNAVVKALPKNTTVDEVEVAIRIVMERCAQLVRDGR